MSGPKTPFKKCPSYVILHMMHNCGTYEVELRNYLKTLVGVVGDTRARRRPVGTRGWYEVLWSPFGSLQDPRNAQPTLVLVQPDQRATTGLKAGTVGLVPFRYAGDRDYGEPPSTRPARTAQSTICCLVLNPSFLWTADTALRTVSALLFLISPISW